MILVDFHDSEGLACAATVSLTKRRPKINLDEPFRRTDLFNLGNVSRRDKIALVIYKKSRTDNTGSYGQCLLPRRAMVNPICDWDYSVRYCRSQINNLTTNS